jgi:hypothetical protein
MGLPDVDITAHDKELLAMILLELLALLAFTWGMVWYFRAPMVPSLISAVVVSLYFCTRLYFAYTQQLHCVGSTSVEQGENLCATRNAVFSSCL